jgi:hypothetical protein
VLVKDVADSLCIHPFMLSKWRKQVRDGELVGKAPPVIYKPLGITRHGAKVTHTEVSGRQVATPRWVKAVAVSLLVLVLAVMGVLHGAHSQITRVRTTSLR